MEQAAGTRKLKSRLAVAVIVLILAGGGIAASASPEAKIKAKFGPECKVRDTCRDMMYIDCNSAADGPAYYVTSGTLEVIGTSGGLCMAGHCSGAPNKWSACLKTLDYKPGDKHDK